MIFHIYSIKIWTELSSVLSQYTRLTDRRTERRTDSFLLTRPPCIHCSMVKITLYMPHKTSAEHLNFLWWSILDI